MSCNFDQLQPGVGQGRR